MKYLKPLIWRKIPIGGKIPCYGFVSTKCPKLLINEIEHLTISLVSVDSTGKLLNGYELPGADPWFLISDLALCEYKELDKILFNGSHWVPVMNDAFDGLIVVEVELVEFDIYDQAQLMKAVKYALANPTN